MSFNVETHNAWDKQIVVQGPGDLRLVVDYDDVDHEEVNVELGKVLSRLNERTDSPYAKWSKIGKPFVQSIRGCARCDGVGHDQLEWKPFQYPIYFGDHSGFVATHWSLCPNSGDPIMMGGYDNENKA